MLKNKGNIYTNQRVILDGNSFEKCEFKNCILEFGATAPVSLVGNKISDCQWSFVGPAALTILFLNSVIRDGGPEVKDRLIQSLFSASAFTFDPATISGIVTAA